MTSPNKARGNALEREVVKKFEAHSISSKRAYGSNGEALGEHCEVDVLVPRQGIPYTLDLDGKIHKLNKQLPALKIQCKRKKVLPKWLGLTENVDCAIYKQDRGPIYIMLTLDEFISRIL